LLSKAKGDKSMLKSFLAYLVEKRFFKRKSLKEDQLTDIFEKEG